MPEALSQSQIDELLNRMKSGKMEEAPEEPEEKVKEYDFTSPKKFTKDQIKSLSSLYENFARIISSYYSSVLRTVCEVEIAQIEEQRFYEFNNALPDNALVGIVDFRPDDSKQFEESTLVFDLSTSFGFFAIDRMLGGNDEPCIPDRTYSDVEMAVLNIIMKNTTRYLQETWQGSIGVTAELRSIETNGRFLQAYSPQDVVVIVSMEIKAGDFSAMANICMLAEALDGLISSFSMRYSRMNKQLDPEKERRRRETVMDDLELSELKMTAILDTCTMTLNQVLQLQPDDVVALRTRIDGDINVLVEGTPWYKARIGEVNMRKAVKIVDTIVK